MNFFKELREIAEGIEENENWRASDGGLTWAGGDVLGAIHDAKIFFWKFLAHSEAEREEILEIVVERFQPL